LANPAYACDERHLADPSQELPGPARRLNGTMTRIVLCVLLLALAGCGGADEGAGPPDRPPEYEGVLEETDGEGRLLVRAEGDACGIWTAPEDRARVFAATGAEIGWADLEPGARVALWIPGPIAESCPMQGAAEAVAVLP